MDVRRSWPAPVLLALALVVTGCASKQPSASGHGSPSASVSPAPTFPLTLTDDDGVSVTITAPPKRIITFAPSNTEIVFALGLGSELVGVSGSFDDYPPQAETITHVGGSGDFGVDPNVEKVVSLQPDLMLTIAGGDQWKARLRELGITVFTINATDFTDLLHDIRTVGEITGTSAGAATLTAQMAAKEQAIEVAVAKEARVSCFFEAYYPPLTTIGPHTFIYDLLERAGCDPVSANAKSDYPEWSVDQLVASGPAVYLVASESGVSAAAVAKRPGFAAIPAVRDGKDILVSSDLISRPGPRVIDGLMALAQALHPAVFSSP
jgi:iron complex transport system substrate-binding protein